MSVRVGVIGTGAIGRDHLRRLCRVLPGAAVVAASDVSAAVARAALKPFAPDARAHENGLELIRDPQVDAVLVCSLGPTHAGYVLAALEANKPVFCEKPLATTVADCRAIVEAEQRGGRRLVQLGFMRPFDAGYRALADVIRSGAIGAPLLAHCAHRNVSSPPYWTDDTPIEDSLVHEIDVLRWLLDDEFTSAQVVFPRRAAAAPAALRDPRVVLLETANGVRVDVELFMNCSYGYDIQCEIVGEHGTARLPDPAAVSVRAGARQATPVLTDWTARFRDSYDSELALFLAGCRDGAIAGPSAWDGLAATTVVEACLRAQREAAIVPIVLPPRPEFYRAPREKTA